MNTAELGIGLAISVGLLSAPALGSAAAAPLRPSQRAAAELQRAVERLGVVGNVLYVAAHPDDENTRLLAYLGNERLLRAAYLSLTRGDGGQNLIGAEQGPLLGLIRTQELLAARGIDGAEQFFTRARDFGYSKTAQETESIWDRDAVLSDVVWVIRRFHPDVIITRFSPEDNETHGHHTASAILAVEAFKAAADPAFHPEQLKYVGTWQARRLLWNRSNWGQPIPDRELPGFLQLDIGGYNPALGESYGEIAADSRSMHKSQGFGAAKSRGPLIEYFKPLLGDRPKAGLFDGLDLSWGRVPGAGHLSELVQEAQRRFDQRHPDAVIPTLLQARAELSRLPENQWKAAKLREITDLIAGCAGLFVEAAASEYAVSPGAPLQVNLVALNRSRAALELLEVRLPGTVVKLGQPLKDNQPVQAERTLTVPRDTPYSNPYWLESPPGKGLYAVSDQQLIGLPERPPPLWAEFVVRAGSETLVLQRPVVYKWTDPVAGERYRGVEVAPRLLVQVDAPVLMFPDQAGVQSKTLRVVLRAGADGERGQVQPAAPPGFVVTPPAAPFEIGKKGGEQEVRFQIRPSAGATGAAAAAGVAGVLPGPAADALRVVATQGEETFSRGILRIDYPHIPIQTLYPQADVKLSRVDLKKTVTRIGYIAGAGDEVPAALRQVGYEVTLLDDAALSGPAHGEAQPLGRFGAIVVGVRAYNTNPRMPAYHQRLMDYVAAGGTLVAQYNTNSRLGQLSALIGPYPFDISHERVTDETAAATMAEHPIWQRPNRITQADFAGWVQERGLYFAGSWSDKYEAPLSMHDKGEPARLGGLLIARHGKGAFIYTGLAFFRQLPAGVPGAYRLFANLISYRP